MEDRAIVKFVFIERVEIRPASGTKNPKKVVVRTMMKKTLKR